MPKSFPDMRSLVEYLNKTAQELYGIENFSDMICDETIAATADDLEAMINFLTEKGHPVFGMEPFDL